MFRVTGKKDGLSYHKLPPHRRSDTQAEQVLWLSGLLVVNLKNEQAAVLGGPPVFDGWEVLELFGPGESSRQEAAEWAFDYRLRANLEPNDSLDLIVISDGHGSGRRSNYNSKQSKQRRAGQKVVESPA